MTIRRIAIISASTILSACMGPFFYKYTPPVPSTTDVKILVRYSGDFVYPQAGYFLNGSNCSDLRDLEIQPLGSREVVARIGHPATFTLGDLSPVKATGTGLEMSSCGFGVSFYPEPGRSYRLNYLRQGATCGLTLTELSANGQAEKNITSLLQQRKPQNQFFNSPDKSFCSDQLPIRN